MTRKNLTKNQHYVPQFLLEGFSLEGSDPPKIHIFDPTRNSLRPHQAIKEVFAQNYFYDKDNVIENFVSDNIEGPASERIHRLRRGDSSLLNNRDTSLIKFVCLQQSRTVGARQKAQEFVNAHFKELASDLLRLNGRDAAEAEGLQIVPKDKEAMRGLTSAVALLGFVDSKAMEDLRFHLLENETVLEFIVSDHPVIHFNWFYKDLADPQVGSLVAKGVQLFMPLSKRLYLCVYDPTTYKYGVRQRDVSDLKSTADVDWLNMLQARSANAYLGFSNLAMTSYVKALAKRFFAKKLHAYKRRHISQEDLPGGEIKTRHLVYTTQVPLRKKPSFFHVLRHAKVYQREYRERNPEVAAAVALLKQRAFQELSEV
jgi:hypothetical protein